MSGLAIARHSTSVFVYLLSVWTHVEVRVHVVRDAD
jgi:hypothetical protein